jgi:peptidoglycan/LPS O-acetylase OafA/YrhL
MRIDQLTFTRFLAAFAIVIFHFGKRIFPFNTEYLSFLVTQANVGVSYFFILSGFIMIISYGKYDHVNAFDYYRNRFARIYPIYLLGLLLYLPIRISIYPVDFIVLFHLAALQSWIPGWAMSYNFPGWSISVEMLFYVIFPFLANHIYKNRKNYKFIVWGTLLFWLATQLLFNYLLHTPFYDERSKHHDLLFYFPMMHLNEFLIGNLAGLCFIKNKNRQGNYDWAILGMVVLLVLALKFPVGLNYHNGLLGIIFIPFILLMSLNTGFISNLFNRKPFVFLGEISYGLYIYQLPIFYYGKNLLSDYPEVSFWINAAILLFVSSVSYIYIEKPLREKIRKLDLRLRWNTNTE